MINYKSFFGFKNEPFNQNIPVDKLYITPGLLALNDRFQYAVKCAGISIVTGDVGSGKSTAIRYAASLLHPSEYKIIPVIATSGSFSEVLRQISLGLGVHSRSTSLSSIMKTIRDIINEVAKTNQIPALIIDEAHLMRIEVFSQLHTLNQFDLDSKPLLPLILVGQNTLIDKLSFHTSRPLASRVLGRTHLEPLNYKNMEDYLKHQLSVAGSKELLFSQEAILAIFQDSQGLLRKTNLLAKAALMAAANEKCQIASPEHVRIASTEIF